MAIDFILQRGRLSKTHPELMFRWRQSEQPSKESAASGRGGPGRRTTNNKSIDKDRFWVTVKSDVLLIARPNM